MDCKSEFSESDRSFWTPTGNPKINSDSESEFDSEWGSESESEESDSESSDSESCKCTSNEYQIVSVLRTLAEQGIGINTVHKH